MYYLGKLDSFVTHTIPSIPANAASWLVGEISKQLPIETKIKGKKIESILKNTKSWASVSPKLKQENYFFYPIEYISRATLLALRQFHVTILHRKRPPNTQVEVLQAIRNLVKQVFDLNEQVSSMELDTIQTGITDIVTRKLPHIDTSPVTYAGLGGLAVRNIYQMGAAWSIRGGLTYLAVIQGLSYFGLSESVQTLSLIPTSLVMLHLWTSLLVPRAREEFTQSSSPQTKKIKFTRDERLKIKQIVKDTLEIHDDNNEKLGEFTKKLKTSDIAWKLESPFSDIVEETGDSTKSDNLAQRVSEGMEARNAFDKGTLKYDKADVNLQKIADKYYESFSDPNDDVKKAHIKVKRLYVLAKARVMRHGKNGNSEADNYLKKKKAEFRQLSLTDSDLVKRTAYAAATKQIKAEIGVVPVMHAKSSPIINTDPDSSSSKKEVKSTSKERISRLVRDQSADSSKKSTKKAKKTKAEKKHPSTPPESDSSSETERSAGDDDADTTKEI